MEELAKQRKRKHRLLIKALGKKAHLIWKERPPKQAATREFFEINLMSMGEFGMQDLGVSENDEQTENP